MPGEHDRLLKHFARLGVDGLLHGYDAEHALCVTTSPRDRRFGTVERKLTTSD